MYKDYMTDNEIEEQIKWFQNNLKKDDLDPADRYLYTKELKNFQLLLKERDFLKLLLLATKIKNKDESVKTLTQSWNLLKKNLEEYTSENGISMKQEDPNYHWGLSTSCCTKMIHLRKNNRNFIIKKIFDDINKTTGKYEMVFDKGFDSHDAIFNCYYFFDFKEWKEILFIVRWFFLLPSDENIELLKNTIERKKLNVLQ